MYKRQYLDRDYQAGEEGLRYAHEKGLSVVIMEPVKGGKLSKASDEIKAIWDLNDIKRTPSEWAIRWVLNHDEVSVMLSGMSIMNQVKENIQTVSSTLPNSLKETELKLIDKVTSVYKKKIKVGCTGCEYCLPCPQNVNIPDIFDIYNSVYVFGVEENSKKIYKSYIEKEMDASRCVECGKCEAICPQNIEIRKHLKVAHNILSE